jgi:hypothetical protein
MAVRKRERKTKPREDERIWAWDIIFKGTPPKSFFVQPGPVA